MKFVKKKDQFGKTYTYLDMEGVTSELLSTPERAQLLEFHYDTYKRMVVEHTDTEWEKVFGPIHLFFDKKCSDKDKCRIAETLAVMQYRIFSLLGGDGEVAGSYLQQLENALATDLLNLDTDIDLFPRFIDFVEEGNIPIQSFAGVGERAQDTPEMSWYRKDVIPLMAVVLVCKLLTPIFGIFMSCFKKKQKQGVIDSSYKEMHCVAILRDILSKRCYATVSKLEIFLHRTIKRVLNKEEDLTHVYNGYTDNTIFQQIYAQMLVRRLVLVDLFRPKGDNNLLTYITVCAKYAASTQFSPSNLKTAAHVFKYPNEKLTNSADDGNLSNLEVESRSSDKTADYSLIVEVAADQTIERMLSSFDMDRDIYEAACNYYTTGTHAALTPFNSYMMGVLYGVGLCGARSVEMLNPLHVVKLTALMQQYLIMQGYLNVAMGVSAQPTGRFRSVISSQDISLRNTWNCSDAFKNCNSRFQIALGGFEWCTGLRTAIDDFTNEEHLVNLAPSLWDMSGAESVNGQIYIPDISFPADVCNFILQQYSFDDL